MTNGYVKIDPVIIPLPEEEEQKVYTTSYALPQKRSRLFELIQEAGGNVKDLGTTAKTKLGNARNVMTDILFGKEIEEPATVISNNGQIESGINNGGRTGGVANFLTDIRSGARENMATPFMAENIMPDKNKGFGYRLGEALGTGARLLDNSLVRGALAYGLSKYNGDSNPLEQGLIAMSTNMQNKTNDKLYRQDLANQGIDTSNIRGFIDNNTYGNLIRSQQLRDNEKYRNQILASNIAQQEALQDYRNKQLGIDWATLQERINERKQKAEEKANKPNKNLDNLQAVTSQLQRFEDSICEGAPIHELNPELISQY